MVAEDSTITRDIIFLSHANHEDNEFTQWLALQLAKEGYAVWCDLTKLLGGEKWWEDIEQIIREKTSKFIYVLSRTSNVKDGPLRELQLAQIVERNEGIDRFVIPILIDDLPFNEINIQLTRINAVSFKNGWANGLTQLLERLDEDSTPKSANFNPDAVTTWWKSQFESENALIYEPEDYYSNWFIIEDLPETIWVHILEDQPGEDFSTDDFSYPAIIFKNYIITFASQGAIKDTSDSFQIRESRDFSTECFLSSNQAVPFIDQRDQRNLIYRLLRMVGERMYIKNNLPTYELSDDSKVGYFTKDLVEGDKVSIPYKDRKTYRQMVGHKTVNKQIRYWHFGVQIRPLLEEFNAFFVKPHVFFSDDGQELWEDKNRMHKARRSQCKDWWNPDWKDRILGVMSWLSNDEDVIEIQVGSKEKVLVSKHPLLFESPVTYTIPDHTEPPIDNMDPFEDMDETEDA